MKQPPGQRPIRDERDKQIDTHSKSEALDFMIAARESGMEGKSCTSVYWWSCPVIL